MKSHFHTGAEMIVFSGVSAIVVINVIRLAIAPLAKRDDWLGKLGQAVGATVTF